MATDASSPRPARRVWWLLVFLLVLVNTIAWQRQPIAAWLGQMAMSRASLDDVEAALGYAALAQRISRQAPEIELARARLERREGDMAAFRRHLQRARHLGIAPERAEREQLLAQAQSGQMRVAGPKLVELLETAGGDEAEICEAYAKGYMRMRDFSSALALLGAWADDFPNDARPHAWIGQIHAELRATEQAERAFRKALDRDPANPSAAFGLGQMLLDLKRSAEAIPFFRIATDDPNIGAAAAAGLAQCLRAQSRRDQAVQVLHESLQRFPDDEQLLVEQAQMLVEQGNYAEAEKGLQTLIGAGSRRREVRYVYATALRGLGRSDEAAKHFEYATEAAERTAVANRRIADVADDPDNAQLRYEIGAAHLRYGNLEDGLMWLQSALEIDPKHRPTHRALADYYERKTADHPRFIHLAQRHRIMGGPSPPGPEQDLRPS